MTTKFKIGDHVRWNSEAGHVSGKIVKVHISDFDYKGHAHRASAADPQYEIKSDKTEHIADAQGHRAAQDRLSDGEIRAAGNAATIWTIGHSTRPIEEFLDLLQTYRIETIADVRSFPGSRKYPHYGKQALARDARRARDRLSTGCRRSAADGERRRTRRTPPGATPRFAAMPTTWSARSSRKGLAQLLELASNSRTALMCAEAVWWRCHRSMIADALSVRGIEVVHILDATHSTVHPMTAPARIVQGRLTYAANADDAQKSLDYP